MSVLCPLKALKHTRRGPEAFFMVDLNLCSYCHGRRSCENCQNKYLLKLHNNEDINDCEVREEMKRVIPPHPPPPPLRGGGGGGGGGGGPCLKME